MTTPIAADPTPGATNQETPQETPFTRTIDGERLIVVFKQLVEPLGRSLPATSEVVLHDLSLLPNSIVAVYGDVTHRRIGDPATDLLLHRSATHQLETVVGYETQLPDGRRLKSSTMVINDVAGNPVAALCINSDTSVWNQVSRIAASMLGQETAGDEPSETGTTGAEAPAGRGDAPVPESGPGAVLRPAAEPAAASAPATPGDPVAGAETREQETGASAPADPEVFVRDVNELADLLLSRAIARVGVPVHLMRKAHKVEAVRILKSRGMFLLRDGVEMVASALDVSRFTIYNYLNEIEAEAPADEPGDDTGDDTAEAAGS
ncbi:helix-turn-helix transcriptional regulator [Brevibacterium sp. 50QC2O2]|uniref:helix-turn-helix transcriptional regulator n=1 Tax=Brevibacterium sp. 50QC2O2 TaxID=2968459 RepID=UPI00211BDD2D|nr:helix-turn-helix transcriptional regulator [Brevibacterium sp. 50QC2O2]